MVGTIGRTAAFVLKYFKPCWSFAGEKGQIGIQLTRVIHVTGITISHVSRFLAYDIRTAPNKFELWGLGFNGRENLDLLHVGAYDIEAAQSVQYFAISSSQTRLYSKVLVKFRSNHGNPDLTIEQTVLLSQDERGTRSAGAVVQGTTLSIKIKVNTDPPKLLDQISTNHKDIVLEERPGSVKPAQPERKEPGINYNI
ncbi:hypothetical protein KEM48_006405 [Puccinia striiformis f. sp. tritici PST-130]|nr:hypothetical protein KEM48_006405 [Puccinia striiformis f. sp. tritici PST-130]